MKTGKFEINVDELRKGGVVKLKDKDMFSLWVRAVCDNMDAVKLRKVAELAEKYAKGYVLFSTRQFPIIPHIHFKDVGAVKDELEKVYVMLDRCGTRVRNPDVCYDANICPYAVMDPISMGEKLDQFWRDDPGGFKIKTSIVGCEKQCSSPRVLADVGFVGAKRSGRRGFDAYLGGKLGLDPFLGIRMAELLSEEECLKFLRNYTQFLRKEGRANKKERAAALIRRLGEEVVRDAVTHDLKQGFSTTPFECDTKQSQKIDKSILRIRATNGEVTSKQVRKIADIAEKYGLGYVHFSVRGGPEIPGVDSALFVEIAESLKEAGLEILDKGIDNLQTCFGGYCVNGNLNTQPLLREVEKIVKKLGLNDLDIKISASGCPNSCGISHLSDIGFMGVVEPEVIKKKCTGCDICAKACRVDAIKIENKLAVIDLEKCKNCDMCIKACPFDALYEKRQGISILVGGRGAYFMDDKKTGVTLIGKKLVDFIDEKRALEITQKILELAREKSKTVAELIDEMGIQNFRSFVLR
ncbi:MAG: 4Fe-4S binding protein [Candidatus Saganbacteria bacterium]|nr:4Fe-4S binding protein [Candidatus Saganbacteria bacterium]